MSRCLCSLCSYYSKTFCASGVLWIPPLKTPLGCALSLKLIWQFPTDNWNECMFMTLHNNCMPLILLRSACGHLCKILGSVPLSRSLSADRILEATDRSVQRLGVLKSTQISALQADGDSVEELEGQDVWKNAVFRGRGAVWPAHLFFQSGLC